MIATDGLSLDQAPPLDLPLRLFLNAPFFAAAAGVVMLWQAEVMLATRWSPAALAATHLLTVGYLGMVMVGALLQVLPVLVGVPVPAVRPVAGTVHVLLGLGAAGLAAGFLGAGAGALAFGATAAVLGFGVAAAALLAALWREHRRGVALRGFPLPMLALVATVLLGAMLTLALLGRLALQQLLDWVHLHAAWGLFGWIGLLVLSVGVQVVPLFHVTPAYPRWVARRLGPMLFVALCGLTLAVLLPATADVRIERLLGGVLAAGFGAFAVLTLWLQARGARVQVALHAGALALSLAGLLWPVLGRAGGALLALAALWLLALLAGAASRYRAAARTLQRVQVGAQHPPG